MTKALKLIALVAVVALVAVGVWWLGHTRATALAPTVADMEVVHASVTVDGDRAVGVERLRVDSAVVTDAEGRARLRLDDGTSAVLDRDTELRITDKGVSLKSGRVFVVGAVDARTEVSVGDASAVIGGANCGLDVDAEAAHLYAANEEIVISAGGKEHKVHAGELATIRGSAVEVTPAKTFDDWTGGLAAPWGVNGSPRRAVGELWGREPSAAAGDPGSPLTIRSHDVEATIDGEVAHTKLHTVFFNGGSSSITGDFRIAIPRGAIVSRFAWGTGGLLEEAKIALARREEASLRPSVPVLEWAGEGWLRGNLPSVPSGATAVVELEYTEWLDPKPSGSGLVVRYRYPMAAASEAPLIGEFSARIDAGPSHPKAIAAGYGATPKGDVVELRRPDFRPSADLVVDVQIPEFESDARSYIADATDDDDLKTVVVRTEAPPAPPDVGATVVLVIDTSGSAEPALLDVSRSFVSAVLDALGPKDRIFVLAADQTARPVGPAEIGAADEARKKAIKDALASLQPGGATDLGRALEAGADALPADAPSGIVVYVGDAWQTVGDPTVEAVQARLGRRAGGVPRLGAAAVGPLANRAALAALTRGSGPLLEITDAADAGGAAASLLSEALRPTVASVQLDLGPEVEQVYPRSARSVIAGDTVTVVGRVRDRMPSAVVVRWKAADGPHEDRRLLSLRTAPDEDDARRRWAAARVEDVVLTGKGREAATDVALRAGLITPWTALRIGTGPYVPSTFDTRLLQLGSESGVTAMFLTPGQKLGALSNIPAEIPATDTDSVSLETALGAAASRVLDAASGSVRACRDSRAALRPDLTGRLKVSFSLNGEGQPSDVNVRGASSEADDAALNRCVEVVVQGLRYPQLGMQVKVRVDRYLNLPPPRSTGQRVKCSKTASLPLPLRRGIWRERLRREPPAAMYVAAKKSCELPTWSAQRALLEVLLSTTTGGVARVGIARSLEADGEAEAARFLRREAVRRAASPDELSAVRVELLGDERYPIATFKKRYRAAGGDAARLDVVQRFLALAPHDAGLRRRMLSLLEALGKTTELVTEIRRIRVDPFADAELLADSASLLRRAGKELEARRTFGELTERAPSDPWARAFLGDRLRNEGWFDDATAAYAALDQIMPEDPGAVVRLALAHAGGGRLDIARRLLARVAQTGGRAGNEKLAELASLVSSVLLAEARLSDKTSKEDAVRLTAAALEVSRPSRGVSVLVFAPAATVALSTEVVRDAGKEGAASPADIGAEGIGVYALSFDPAGSGKVRLRLSRPEALPPTRPTAVRIRALTHDGDLAAPPELVRLDVELPIDGKPVEIGWREGSLKRL